RRKSCRTCGQQIAASVITLAFLAGTKAPTAAKGSEPPAPAPPPELLPSMAEGDLCSPALDDPPEAASVRSAGGDLPARRYIVNPYPTFNGLPLDVKNDR